MMAERRLQVEQARAAAAAVVTPAERVLAMALRGFRWLADQRQFLSAAGTPRTVREIAAMFSGDPDELLALVTRQGVA